MIGAVQILAIGYKQADMPSEIRNQINLLRSNPAVRLLDVYAINKAKNRIITEQAISGIEDWEGGVIRRILGSASASRFMHSYSTFSSGFLVQGSPIPELKDSVPAGTNVVVLLIEHTWANPLETALRNGSAFPVAGGWVGREALEDAGLAMSDAAV